MFLENITIIFNNNSSLDSLGKMLYNLKDIGTELLNLILPPKLNIILPICLISIKYIVVQGLFKDNFTLINNEKTPVDTITEKYILNSYSDLKILYGLSIMVNFFKGNTK